MGGALRGSAGLMLCLGVVMMMLLGLATPASSLLINTTNAGACSRVCESENCLDPTQLRYGKFCGFGYTACSGEAPCDGLDTCCQTHDVCIGPSLGNSLNRTCNENLKTCVNNFKDTDQPQFPGANCSGSTVARVIVTVVNVATLVSHGNPSFSMNLHWVTMAVFILSVLLLHG